MTFWIDKEGNRLSFKEFIARWKVGIEGITPIGRLKTQLNGTGLMLIGISLGIIMTLFAFKQMWWITIILIGALFNTFIQYVGQKEQLKLLLNIEKEFLDSELNEKGDNKNE